MLLKPQLNLAATYSDNINFRETGELADFVLTISPGLAVQIGSKELNYAELTYFYDRIQYLEHTEFDANQHRISIGSRFQRSRFTLEGRDRIELLSSPLGGGYSISGQMVDRTTFSDFYRLDYDFTERTGLYAAITHTATDFDKEVPLYDSRTISGTLGFTYKAFSRTFFFGEIYYGQTENEHNVPTMFEYPSTTFVGGFAGARGYFTEKLTGTVKAGFEAREYDTVSEGSSAPVVEASLAQQFTERTSATLAYSRRQQESVQFVRSTYVTDSVSGSVTQSFGSDDRLRGNVQAGYMMSSYETNSQFANQEREDNGLTAGLTITYDIKLWMRLFGGYSFEMLDSTEPSLADYQVNRVTLGLQLGY